VSSPPHDIFPKGNTLNQVLRRIDEIKHMTHDVIYDDEVIDVQALFPQELEPQDNIDELII